MENEMLLQFHGWRRSRPRAGTDLAALFCFSLMPLDSWKSGDRPRQGDVFWTEVELPAHLAQRPGWRELPRDDRIKCMFQHAVDEIVRAKRKLRQAPLVWTPSGRFASGPPWDPTAVRFPKMPPVVFDGAEPPDAPRFLARKGAGLER